MAALHVGSERLLAGFDDWKGSHTLDALRGRRITAVSARSSARVLTPEATEHFDSMLLSRQNNTAVSERSSASVLTPQATEHFDSMLLTLRIIPP